MNTKAFGQVLIPALAVVFIAACSVEQPVDIKTVMSRKKSSSGRTPANSVTWNTTILGK